MRLTNRKELRARRQAGSVPVTATRVAATPTPASSNAAVPRRHDTADAPASARGRRGRSAEMLRTSPRNATRPSARRQPHRRGNARSQDHASPSVCAALRRRTSPLPTPTQQRTGFALTALSWPPGILAHPPATSRPKAPPVSCHPPLRTGTRSRISPVYWTQ
jgi:hypothetical protein